MSPKIKIREIKKINLEEGYLIDGFPSVGFTSAIATESMIHTSQFELGGVIDSETFPPISVVKDGKPNFPTRIFVNEELKVGIFLSYLTLDQSLHRITAETMLSWAKQHKIKLIISSIAIKSPTGDEEMIGIGIYYFLRQTLFLQSMYGNILTIMILNLPITHASSRFQCTQV